MSTVPARLGAELERNALTIGTVVAVIAGTTAAVGSGRVVPVLLVALMTPVLVAILRRPQRGLLLLAALVPFDGLLALVPDGATVAGWKEALLLMLVVGSFVAPAEARRPAGRRRPGWVPGVAAFAALGLASAVIVGGGQGLLGAKIGFFYLLVAVVAWRCPLDARERDRLVTILMVAGVVTAAYGIAQQLIGHARLNEIGYEYNSTIRFAGGYLRSFSTFVQPFPFGFFLMLVLLVGLASALAEPGRLRNRLFLIAVPVVTIGLATSVVRGAWLGLAAGLLYLAITRHRDILLILPLVVIGLVVLPAEATGAVLSSASSSERVEGWERNVARVAEHPFGEGIGATGATAERLLSTGPAGSATQAYQPDNYFVKTGIELGVLGVWLLVLTMLAALHTAHRAAGAPGRDGALGAGAAAYVVAAVAASIVSTFFEIFPMEVYFWLLLTVVSGLVTAPAERAARHPAGTHARPATAMAPA